ncbi:MAG: hypothetical protein METHP_00402 [Methanoregula sp. SKADARSKE-2]|nr:MAG: hypothetical protein METHP_00402 [Methanoregula sp. SKADARSKE-2]
MGSRIPAPGIPLHDRPEPSGKRRNPPRDQPAGGPRSFTTVDLNSNQEWSFKWNTARLLSLIDPGTYTVYITTEAVDLSHLGGRSTYKTLNVYLQDAGISQGSSEPGTYTLNPEKHSSSISAVPSMIIATPAPTLNQSTPIPVATITASVTTTSLPLFSTPTQAGMLPITPAIVAVFLARLIVIRRFS